MKYSAVNTSINAQSRFTPEGTVRRTQYGNEAMGKLRVISRPLRDVGRRASAAPPLRLTTPASTMDFINADSGFHPIIHTILMKIGYLNTLFKSTSTGYDTRSILSNPRMSSRSPSAVTSNRLALKLSPYNLVVKCVIFIHGLFYTYLAKNFLSVVQKFVHFVSLLFLYDLIIPCWQ